MIHVLSGVITSESLVGIVIFIVVEAIVCAMFVISFVLLLCTSEFLKINK